MLIQCGALVDIKDNVKKCCTGHMTKLFTFTPNQTKILLQLQCNGMSS